MALTEKQLLGREKICDAAVLGERATGFPAELAAAQAILESGYLQHLPPGSNNCFGVKDTDRYPGASYAFTKEYINGEWMTKKLAFEKYPSLAECFKDHAWLLTRGKHYQPAWEQYQHDHNLDKFAAAISKHYATDPKYGSKVAQIMNSQAVAEIVQKYRAKYLKEQEKEVA